jgi:hypothetical protein
MKAVRRTSIVRRTYVQKLGEEQVKNMLQNENWSLIISSTITNTVFQQCYELFLSVMARV